MNTAGTVNNTPVKMGASYSLIDAAKIGVSYRPENNKKIFPDRNG